MTFRLLALVIFIPAFLASCATQHVDVEDAKLAEFYYSKAYYSESERIFLKLKEKMPDNYDLHFRLGNIYVRTGQFQAAEDMYNRCIEIDPSEPKGWYNLSLLRVKQAIHLSEQGHRKSHFTDPDFAKQFVFLRDGLIKSITGK